MKNKNYTNVDPIIEKMIDDETKRQNNHVELIASENYASRSVMEVTGCSFTNKYAEGYPYHRYYDGCEIIDQGEQLAIDRIKKLFNCKCSNNNCKKSNAHANVQPHSGSQANASAYYAVLNPGDTVLALGLAEGGHLTHGHKVNFSGRFYNFVHYKLNQETEQLDYKLIRERAITHKPKLIVAGASAYSLKIDFSKFREIADECGAYLMTDIAHIAGLIVAGLHQNPVCYADIITSTTHKTLRGPRGGFILCSEELSKKIDSAVFPGNQGGPLEHVILAKAQAFYEAAQPSFITYQKQIIKNCKTFMQTFKDHGFRIVSGNTDNHLFIINTLLSPIKLTGKKASSLLSKANIITNKNVVPFDTKSPFVTSGVRVGTPAMTTRGFKETQFIQLAKIIIDIWSNYLNAEESKWLAWQNEVKELLKHYPMY